MSPRISIRLLAGQSDERLLALVRDGHERAFEALVYRYRRPLLRYLRRAVGVSDSPAEDVVQQALLQAWLALVRGTEVRDLKPWLYRIAHNTAVNAIRGSGERHLELVAGSHGSEHAADELRLERRMDAREALSHVAALPNMQRQAILLTAIDGQSHEEVASALGISAAAVRGLIYRARTALRSAAATITPQPLLAWELGTSSSAAPTAERVAEIDSGGGAFGAAGVLLKGAAVAISAGALATGAAVVHEGHHAARRAQARGSSASTSAVTVRESASPAAGSPTQVLLARVDAKSIAGERRLVASRRGSGSSPGGSRRAEAFFGSPRHADRHSTGGGDHGDEAPETDLGGEAHGPARSGDGATTTSGPSTQPLPAGEPSGSGSTSGDGSGSTSGDGAREPSVGQMSGSSDDGARLDTEPTSDDLSASGR